MKTATTITLFLFTLTLTANAQVGAPKALRFGEDREGAYGGPDSVPRVLRVINDNHMLLLLRDAQTLRLRQQVIWRGPNKGYYDGKNFNWSDILGDDFRGMIRCAGTIQVKMTDGSRKTYVLYERWTKESAEAKGGK